MSRNAISSVATRCRYTPLTLTWPTFTAVVTRTVLTDGAVEAGFREAVGEWSLAVFPSEGRFRAVTSVSETCEDYIQVTAHFIHDYD